jgi:23S rRNA U2552 (ribose-2'-O)-methylase RlmE/FtsJ
MIQFQVPRTSTELYKHIDYSSNEDQPIPILSNSLSHYLYDIKERIDAYEYEWDVFKRYTNPYEYIHTSVPQKRKSVSKHKPLSRSYFKMIELTNFFKLIETDSPIKSFHLAEGPGGFIEAMVHMRRRKDDQYIGMTILDNDNDSSIPSWKKSENFLRENSNVYIEKGATETGDILSLDNFFYCIEKYASSMDIITGDGGFDFSMDFNKQETHIANLLFAQISFTLCMQKQNGSFILKIFDSFMQHTIDLIAILSSFYEKIYITKPQTSRYANSEKYLVCKGFLHDSNEEFKPFLYSAFKKMVEKDDNNSVYRFLNNPLSNFFTTRIEEYNAIFGQQQIENIYYTISLIENKHKNEKIDTLIKQNAQRCINWCIKYNIDHNQLLTNTTNCFLTMSD